MREGLFNVFLTPPQWTQFNDKDEIFQHMNVIPMRRWVNIRVRRCCLVWLTWIGWLRLGTVGRPLFWVFPFTSGSQN